MEGYREDLDLGMRILKKFGLNSIKYCPSALIGTLDRREKVFGYPIWKFPSAWKKGVRGGKKKENYLLKVLLIFMESLENSAQQWDRL